MEKFYLEELSILRKNEFIDYLNEFVESYNKEYIILYLVILILFYIKYYP